MLVIKAGVLLVAGVQEVVDTHPLTSGSDQRFCTQTCKELRCIFDRFEVLIGCERPSVQAEVDNELSVRRALTGG